MILVLIGVLVMNANQTKTTFPLFSPKKKKMKFEFMHIYIYIYIYFYFIEHVVQLQFKKNQRNRSQNASKQVAPPKVALLVDLLNCQPFVQFTTYD